MAHHAASQSLAEVDRLGLPAVQRLLAYRQRTFIITGCRDDRPGATHRWTATICEVLADRRLAHWVDVATGGETADSALRAAALAAIEAADRSSGSPAPSPPVGTLPRPGSLAATRR
jgi:hypothetical protein